MLSIGWSAISLAETRNYVQRVGKLTGNIPHALQPSEQLYELIDGRAAEGANMDICPQPQPARICLWSGTTTLA
jgi:hypothetical protein